MPLIKCALCSRIFIEHVEKMSAFDPRSILCTTCLEIKSSAPAEADTLGGSGSIVMPVKAMSLPVDVPLVVSSFGRRHRRVLQRSSAVLRSYAPTPALVMRSQVISVATNYCNRNTWKPDERLQHASIVTLGDLHGNTLTLFIMLLKLGILIPTPETTLTDYRSIRTIILK